MQRFIIIAAASFVFAGSANAVTVTNGSFEIGVPISGGNELLSTGDMTSITGWTILGPGGVDYVDNSLWGASDGARSVELAGFSPGGVAQQISSQFVIGQSYVMRFDLSANPFAANGIYGTTVSVTGAAPLVFNYEKTNANAPGAMNYLTYTYAFTATSDTKTIQFLGNGSGPLSIVLDNVSISAAAVPEPTTWAMLILGFGAVGGAMRRRSQSTAQLRLR